jgi:hypothetical protein
MFVDYLGLSSASMGDFSAIEYKSQITPPLIHPSAG